MTRLRTLRRAHEGDALTIAGHRYPDAGSCDAAVRALYEQFGFMASATEMCRVAGDDRL